MRALLDALQRTVAAGGVLAVQDGNLLPQQQMLELVATAEAAGHGPALTLLSSDPRLLGTAVLKLGSLACVELPLVRPLRCAATRLLGDVALGCVPGVGRAQGQPGHSSKLARMRSMAAGCQGVPCVHGRCAAQEPAGRLALNRTICASMPGAKGKVEGAVPGLFAGLLTCDWPSAPHGLVSEDLQGEPPASGHPVSARQQPHAPAPASSTARCSSRPQTPPLAGLIAAHGCADVMRAARRPP